MVKNMRIQFKYRLSMIFFLIVVLISAFLGVFQYNQMKKVLQSNYEYDKKMLRNNVVSAVKYSDRFYYAVEKGMEPSARRILEQIKSRYAQTGLVDFDLHPYVKNQPDFNVTIININNRVVNSVDETKLGMNYNNFYKYLDFFKKIRTSGSFFSDRFNIAANTSDVKKAFYLPSTDGSYIFCLDVKLKKYINQLEGYGFDNFDVAIDNKTDFLDSVILYNSDGNSYKHANYEIPSHINYKYIGYLSQAIKTDKTVTFKGILNGKEVMFEYIPYKLTNAYGINKVNVIELVFNNNTLVKNLQDNLKIIYTTVILGAIFSLLLGFLFASVLSRPLVKLSEAARKIAGGNYNVAVGIEGKDEIGVLGKNFDKMAMEISTLMEIRKQKEETLQRKNKEIYYQNEEISALYEETAAMNEELEDLLEINRRSYLETVSALASAIEAKDQYTRNHSNMVRRYSVAVANELDLSQKELEELKVGSLLHDIGKIGIAEAILNKEGKLTDEEYEMIKRHPAIGHNILKDVNMDENCRKIVREHHERFDGKGYPLGLQGENINYLARIVCVADAFHAMTSKRIYRHVPLTLEQAIKELENNKGTQFDPDCVDAMLSWIGKQENMESIIYDEENSDE